MRVQKIKEGKIGFLETFLKDYIYIIIYHASMGREKYNLSGDLSYEIAS